LLNEKQNDQIKKACKWQRKLKDSVQKRKDANEKKKLRWIKKFKDPKKKGCEWKKKNLEWKHYSYNFLEKKRGWIFVLVWNWVSKVLIGLN
jgi:broad specificity polyphosphatase/5'/3'-nucleotidase SurE